MVLVVCGLADIETIIAARRPSHMITLLDPASMIETPAAIAPERHLRVGVNDIVEPTEGLVLPDHRLVEGILEFGRGWNGGAPMIIHCWAGISRSTASAFALACERSPHADERDIALAMRKAAPHAYPNRRIVALADDVLGRGGRMVRAVSGMGASTNMYGTAFDFAARHE